MLIVLSGSVRGSLDNVEDVEYVEDVDDVDEDPELSAGASTVIVEDA